MSDHSVAFEIKLPAAQEAAVRMTAERQAREQAELRRVLEQDFAANQRQTSMWRSSRKHRIASWIDSKMSTSDGHSRWLWTFLFILRRNGRR